jgi:ribosomal protein L37AE/L43A
LSTIKESSMSLVSYSHDGPECPKCGFTFTPDEPHYYDEAMYTHDECPDCGSKFSVSVMVTTSWECEMPEALLDPETELPETCA